MIFMLLYYSLAMPIPLILTCFAGTRPWWHLGTVTNITHFYWVQVTVRSGWNRYRLRLKLDRIWNAYQLLCHTWLVFCFMWHDEYNQNCFIWM